MYPDTFYATIEEISDSEIYGIKTIKVNGIELNDKKHREKFYFDVYLDNIPDNVKIQWNNTSLDFSQLKVGQTIAIYNYGEIQNSNPSKLTNVRMIVVLDDKL